MMHQESAEQICTAQYRVGNIEVKAVLFACHHSLAERYGILLEQPGERAYCDLGTDLMQARKLYFDVAFGKVTACTLSDIVEDCMGTHF